MSNVVETQNFSKHRLNRYIFYFLMYSFIGWCIEVSYVSSIKGYFVNRGFLIGPFCCIYGFGALIIIVFLKQFKHNPLLLFTSASIFTTILEYFTGYFLEKAFNNKWWDYSDQPFNIAGRICLRNSLIWGVIAVLAIYFIHPFIRFIVLGFIRNANPIIVYFIIIYFVSDFILSAAAAAKLNPYADALNVIIQQIKSFIHYMHDVTFKGFESIRSEILNIIA